MILSVSDLTSLMGARHASPHDLLGMHNCSYQKKRGLVVRVVLQDAAECAVVDPAKQERWPMERLDEAGAF